MVIIKNSTGHFYKEGSGFIAIPKDQATRLSTEDANCVLKCASKFGFDGSTEEAPATKSFAVCYVRKNDVAADGTVTANLKNPSRRRFATIEEARTHGNRFHVRKASWGAAPGSAGHQGYYVIETSDPVTDVVNPKTGLTNPAPGTGGSRFRRK
jgi:hypothetical protein